MKILKILGLIVLVVLLLGVLSGVYINSSFPKVEPAPVLEVVRTEASIERGRYLANHVAACMDCHSTRDWSLFSGPIVAGTEGKGGEAFTKAMGFPGEIYSPNLTPRHLGVWSDGEIYRAITSGVAKDGRALFPVMNYHRFGSMPKQDVEAIIGYLRTLKPIDNEVPPPVLDFPVSILNKLGPKKAQHSAMPDPTHIIAYGAYLVNAAGCADCHSQVDKGKVIAGTEFGGGMEFKQPAGILRAPNITMHKTKGIGSWTKELFVQKFKAYDPKTAVLPKVTPTQLITPMPWTMYAGMKEKDLAAIYAYLKSLKPQENEVVVRDFAKN
jgi:hypothetical protein